MDEIGSKPHRSYSQSKTHRSNKKPATTYVVKKGDSLYSIGFRYQIDYKKLAAINGITAPYRIYPKQVLQLKGEPKVVTFKPSNSQVQTKPLVRQAPIKAKPEPVTKPVANSSQPSTQPVSKPQQKPAVASTNNQATTNKPVTSKPAVKPVSKPASKPITVATPNNSNLKWLWPTDGKIRTTFLASNPARKGISIGGKEGQAVKAAEAGVVVYSGNGLLGYGELIIIKHNDAYLSAYGHNRSLKVKEGQSVTRGQVIAELGSTGTNVNNLHFEIRKNGKPVNPLNFVKP